MQLNFDNLINEPPQERAITVSELNEQIADIIGDVPQFRSITVTGEVSNFKRQRSGHCYFSLKDENAQIRCCLWKFQVPRVKFLPNDGDLIEVRGKVEFYEKGGSVNFIVNSIEFAGQGALWEAFNRLKNKLENEGLFDPSRKKSLPKFPQRIAVITSASGAVWHDITHVLERRWPLLTVICVPAVMQGTNAPESVRSALQKTLQIENLDAVIIARGGGSAEDLWCFNDELLARDVADFSLPVISAIGHETDFTILDFVADLRAPTPSAAAEEVSPDRYEILQQIAELQARQFHQLSSKIAQSQERFAQIRRRMELAHPISRVEREQEKLEQLKYRLKSTFTHRVSTEKQRFAALHGRLRALNPVRVMERGYAIVRSEKGDLMTTATQSQREKVLLLTFHDGEIKVDVP